MDKDSLKEVLHKKFSALHKDASKATDAFDKESIHDLRVGYKKLRAFLRALKTDENQKLPDTFKKLYRSAGALRDSQLYFEAITNYCGQNQKDMPTYTGILSEEMKQAEHAFKEAVKETPFDKIKEQLEENLPGTLPDERIIEYVENKKHRIRILVDVPRTDAGIHAIRKDLKDILYTFNTFKDEHFLVVTDSQEQVLKKATDTLGTYIDICTNLAMLEDGLLKEIPEDEKAVLLQLQQSWTHEKLVQKTAVEVTLPGVV
jgi:CHAD domain-containing protein